MNLTCKIEGMFLVPRPPPEPVTLKLVPSGAAKKVGYGLQEAEVGDAPTAKPVPGLAAPKYGRITLGAKSIAFAISEPVGTPARLIVDSNGDGDLSNDAPVTYTLDTKSKV